jgi:pimeloyl-ACP methyl ester carboxylesterase
MALPIVLVPGLLVPGLLVTARLVTVAESGHLSTLERPAQVTAALTEWLRA